MGKAHTKLTTFWSQKRLESGLTLDKLSSDIGIAVGALRTYLDGEHIPREYAMRKICHYFDVDFVEGRLHFIEDHEVWQNRHPKEWHNHDTQRERTYYKRWYRDCGYNLCINFSKEHDADLYDKLSTIELGNRAPYVKWVLRQHLGNDTFSTERFTSEVQNLLKVIYSEVPFEIFMQMLSSLTDTKTIDAKLLYGYVSYPTFLKVYKLQDRI